MQALVDGKKQWVLGGKRPCPWRGRDLFIMSSLRWRLAIRTPRLNVQVVDGVVMHRKVQRHRTTVEQGSFGVRT